MSFPVADHRRLARTGVVLMSGAALLFLLYLFQESIHFDAVFGRHLSIGALAVFYLILFASGWISGLSGFGFSAVGCIILLFLPPKAGVAMLMCLSILTQSMSFGRLLPKLRPHMAPLLSADGVFAYALGGLLAVPFGIGLLTSLNPKSMMMLLGVLLVLYSAYSMFKLESWRVDVRPNWFRSMAIGGAGGLVGGFSAFPGSALVIWTGLTGACKDKTRALTQPYIMLMQVVSIFYFSIRHGEVFNLPFLLMFVAASPFVLLGNRYGTAGFMGISQERFRIITLATLGISGLSLLYKVVFA